MEEHNLVVDLVLIEVLSEKVEMQRPLEPGEAADYMEEAVRMVTAPAEDLVILEEFHPSAMVEQPILHLCQMVKEAEMAMLPLH